jgi:hypothetical protein
LQKEMHAKRKYARGNNVMDRSAVWRDVVIFHLNIIL